MEDHHPLCLPKGPVHRHVGARALMQAITSILCRMRIAMAGLVMLRFSSLVPAMVCFEMLIIQIGTG